MRIASRVADIICEFFSICSRYCCPESCRPPPFSFVSIRTWAVYVKEGLITSANSKEDPNTPLSKELTFTYLKDDEGTIKKTVAQVGRGKFLLTDEGEEDELVPDEIWSHATPKHQVTLANPGN